MEAGSPGQLPADEWASLGPGPSCMCAHTPTLLALTTPCCSQAYRLNPKVGGPFMQEALDEMVLLLTKPEYKGKMVVILAGYEAEVG